MKIINNVRSCIALLGIGAMALAGCEKSASERFSTPEARVFNPGLAGGYTSFEVDFKGFRDSNEFYDPGQGDARLSVDQDEKGGFDLYLGIAYHASETYLIIRDGQLTDLRPGRRWTRDLKGFEAHSPEKASLDADVRKLLAKGKKYAGSREYYDDLRTALQPTQKQHDGTLIITTFYQEAGYDF